MSTTIYRYKSLDDLLNPQTTHFNSVGIRPTIQLTYPTRWEHVRFIPSAEVQLTRRLDLDTTLLSGSVSGQLRYENDISAGFLTTYGSLKYGTRYDSDGLNQDDYVRLKFKAALDRSLGWKIKEHTQYIVPFVSASYFFNDFQFGDNQGNFTDVDTEYELGIKLASKPRMKLGKVRVPELQLSIVIAEDVKGLKIRF